MRQIIKNAVHSLTHTMGLPLHRIAFAWTGDRSTPARDLLPQPPPGTGQHKLLKDPHTIYEAISDKVPWDTSLFLLASCDESTGLDPWPRGHSLLLGSSGVSGLINAPQIITYLRLLMCHFQTCVLQEPPSLNSPLPPSGLTEHTYRNQRCGTERLALDAIGHPHGGIEVGR